jgi:hypothetical protein
MKAKRQDAKLLIGNFIHNAQAKLRAPSEKEASRQLQPVVSQHNS